MPKRVWLVLAVGSFTAALGQNTGGYTGPAVLSRAGAPLGKYLGQPITFRFHAGVQGSYYTDLFTPAIDEAGNLITESGPGVIGTVGVYGARNGPHDTLAVDFLAAYRAYSRTNLRSYNGADARLGLDYARQTSVKTAFELGVNAATYSYSYGGLYQPVVPDPSEELDGSAVEPFDTRTTRLSARAGVSHFFTQRWYITLRGGGYTAQRRSAALLDYSGFSGGAALQYRLSENTTIGPTYEYSQFYFSANVGQSWIHDIQLALEHKFSPHWQIVLGAGVYRVRSERVTAVPLDPVIAAIIGRPTTLQPVDDRRMGPSIRATLSRSFQRGSLSFYLYQGVRPGNSFMATSETTSFGVSYSYTATSRVNFGLRANYYRANATMESGVKYDNYGAGAAMGVRLTRSLHFTAGVDYRTQELRNSSYNRNRMRAFVGLVFSPGEVPVSLF